MYRLLFLLTLLALITGCVRVSEKNNSVLNARDYVGEWSGLLPCADCDAVDYRLKLKEDHSYESTVSYLGVGQANPSTTSGTWQVSGSHLLIMDGEEKDTLSMLPEAEHLIVLGPGGSRMSGPEAKYYKLSKVSNERTEKPAKENVFMEDNDYGFKGQGNEPFWSLRINFDKYIRFHKMGEDTIAVPVPEAQTAGTSDLLYVAETDKAKVKVVIKREKCADTMADKEYLYAVTAIINGDSLTGCGEYMFKEDILGEWALKSMDGTAVPADTMRSPHIIINEKGSSISGNTGCNNFSGMLWVEGNKLRLNGIRMTRMNCPGNTENRFLEIMQSRPAYFIENDTLTIMESGKEVMTFQRKKS